MKIIFGLFLLFAVCLFATPGDTQNWFLILCSKVIPGRLGNTLGIESSSAAYKASSLAAIYYLSDPLITKILSLGKILPL